MSQHYYMNDFSEDANKRTKLFHRIAEQNNMTVLPGRYGGEYNNDMIAIGDKHNSPTLWLGLKVTGDKGDLQLDKHSMGGFLQFSSNWLKMVITSLHLQTKHHDASNFIEQALITQTLSLGVVYIDIETKQPNVLPMAIQD